MGSAECAPSAWGMPAEAIVARGMVDETADGEDRGWDNGEEAELSLTAVEGGP